MLSYSASLPTIAEALDAGAVTLDALPPHHAATIAAVVREHADTMQALEKARDGLETLLDQAAETAGNALDAYAAAIAEAEESEDYLTENYFDSFEHKLAFTDDMARCIVEFLGEDEQGESETVTHDEAEYIAGEIASNVIEATVKAWNCYAACPGALCEIQGPQERETEIDEHASEETHQALTAFYTAHEIAEAAGVDGLKDAANMLERNSDAACFVREPGHQGGYVFRCYYPAPMALALMVDADAIRASLDEYRNENGGN